MRRLKTVRRPPIYPKTPGHLPCSSLTPPPFRCPHAVHPCPSVDSGLGYLYIDGQGGEGTPQTATHAWVECRLPDLQWIGFDPTNRCLADERHVRVAIGRDYRDVTPVRGIFVGSGEARLAVGVRVRTGCR